MKIPYVIDNRNHLMVDILDAPLAEHKGRSLDVATAYFTVNGFGLVRAGLAELAELAELGNLRTCPPRFSDASGAWRVAALAQTADRSRRMRR
jgi:hypothetical protein